MIVGVLDDYEDWLRATQPDLFTLRGVYSGSFRPGPTSGDCALAWLETASAYLEATSGG